MLSNPQLAVKPDMISGLKRRLPTEALAVTLQSEPLPEPHMGEMPTNKSHQARKLASILTCLTQEPICRSVLALVEPSVCPQ
jgi:hypothetical protein